MVENGTTHYSFRVRAQAWILVVLGQVLLLLSVWLFVLRFTKPEDGMATAWPQALAVDLGLLLLFALQHSGMARPGFKSWLRPRVPPLLERPLYVVASGIAFCSLLHFWAHPPGVLFDVRGVPALSFGLRGVALIAGLFTLRALGETGAGDLVGLTDARCGVAEQERPLRPLRTAGTYALVRHPLLVGTIAVFWCWHVVSMGRALFACAFTLYALWAAPREERALMRCYGDEYATYTQRVGRWWPRWRRAA